MYSLRGNSRDECIVDNLLYVLQPQERVEDVLVTGRETHKHGAPQIRCGSIKDDSNLI
jgi:hypothetical protein